MSCARSLSDIYTFCLVNKTKEIIIMIIFDPLINLLLSGTDRFT